MIRVITTKIHKFSMNEKYRWLGEIRRKKWHFKMTLHFYTLDEHLLYCHKRYLHKFHQIIRILPESFANFDISRRSSRLCASKSKYSQRGSRNTFNVQNRINVKSNSEIIGMKLLARFRKINSLEKKRSIYLNITLNRYSCIELNS